jgi:palmitoyl-protein thioesterase
MLTNLEKEVREGTKGHAECIEIGNGMVSSIFNTMIQQSEEACRKIKAHPVFGNRQFNILGLSQGSLIGRYIVETCEL